MSFLASLAVLAALTNPASPATTAFTDHPVQVAQCASYGTFAPVLSGDVTTDEQIGSDLNIRFVNTSQRTLRSVTFDVAQNGGDYQIKDVGSFAPGVAISHNFAQGIVPDGATACSVASVEYAPASM